MPRGASAEPGLGAARGGAVQSRSRGLSGLVGAPLRAESPRIAPRSVPGREAVGGAAVGAGAPRALRSPFSRLLLGQQLGPRPPERPGLANISGL